MNYAYSKMGRDFALVVWSDVAPLRVVHNGGLISAHWDDFSLDDSIEINYDFSNYSPNT